MTKPIFIAAAVALALSVAACGRDDDAAAPVGPTSSTTTPANPTGGPLVTGETSSPATGGTTGLGASGTGTGGTSTSTPGMDSTGSQSGTGGASMSPDSNTPGAAGTSGSTSYDAEKSQQR